MENRDLFALMLAAIGALATSALFLDGVWHILHSPRGRGLVRTIRGFMERAHWSELARTLQNPVLTPTQHMWEAAAVMNPGAVESDGRVHLFYRAVGTDGASRVGYASSPDGVRFDERLPYPVFSQGDGDPMRAALLRHYNPTLYAMLAASGGSWSGTEDPRAVKIGNRIYLTFSAFQGWDSLRMGVTSLAEEDFKKKRWAWSAPVFLSPPHEVHKNWVLFPKKIHGKFALFHGFAKGDRNRVQIRYLDTLDAEPFPAIKSDKGFRDEMYANAWDSKIRGAGPPPIEMDEGWLLLYHATDTRDPDRYKLGALLLDKDDPSRIIARSPLPILAADMQYENEGKPGVVYACGTAVKDGLLMVYYGGAEQVVCAAATPLSDFVEKLARSMPATLSPLPRTT